jgi:hypothetical protein
MFMVTRSPVRWALAFALIVLGLLLNAIPSDLAFTV